MSDTLDHTARIRNLEREARELRQDIERQQCRLLSVQHQIDLLTLEHGIASSHQPTAGRWRKVTRSTILAVIDSRNAGMTYSAIGDALGISGATANQIFHGKYHNQTAILASGTV